MVKEELRDIGNDRGGDDGGGETGVHAEGGRAHCDVEHHPEQGGRNDGRGKARLF